MAHRLELSPEISKRAEISARFFVFTQARPILSTRRAEGLNLTFAALRGTSIAAASSVPDQPMTQQGPLITRCELHQRELDFLR